MSVRPIYLYLLGAALVLYLLSRTDKGQSVVADVTDSIASSIIGLRLNNPLNIERGDNWQGLADVQSNARFAEFISMPYGIRAAAITLRNYQAKYGLNSVAAIVNRWNPVSDGQPSSYIPNVADYMGVPATLSLDLSNRNIMFALIRGMIRQEIGVAGSLLVSDDDVNEGLDLAGYA